MMEPSWRKPAGVLLMLGLIAAWAVMVLVVSPSVLKMHWTLQALFFLVAGVAWIVPLKPLLRWMETGRFR